MSPQANETIVNLDIRCAEVGRLVANAENMEEKVLNEALAVLEEQGLYAMFLYVKARHSKTKEAFKESGLSLLREVFGDRIRNSRDELEVIKQLAENLDDLLFARDLLRNALSYARYHLKARGR